MSILKEKKGFTLIELLAVIVVLAIVMVLATTTVLPYMANARKDSFATEANTVKSAASQAVSLITIGSVTGNYKTNDGYCFTISDLKTLGLLEKDDTNYAGVVKVTQSGNAYSYTVSMKNASYYVTGATGNIGKSVVKDVTDSKPTATEVPTSCS